MNHRTIKPLFADALDTLLSLKSSITRHAIAFSQIEAVVAPLAFSPPPNLINAFLRSQDSMERNLVTGLLEWLGRTLVKFESYKGTDLDKVRDNVSRCLGLIQGLLLLHRPSQRLFARRSSLEYLVAVVELTRASTHSTTTPLASPHASPHPSPVLFPSSPAFHQQSDPLQSAQANAANSIEAQQRLAIAALDTLLCALVDRPKNMRAFEESGGLETIVKVLKDRNVAQPVRIKIIEILYYYLLPETELSRSHGSTPSSTYSAGSYPSSAESLSSLSSTAFTHSRLPAMLANTVNDFVPQTPTKPKPASQHHRSNSLSDREQGPSPAYSRDPSPSRTPQRPRGLRHKRSQSLLAFPTQPAPPVTSPRTLSQSVSAPNSDSESTPRPRFVRSSRNPLEPIPASPDLSRPRTSSHRRTQSTSATPSDQPPKAIFSPRPPTRTRREERETSMLPPPVPLSRSTSTRLPPPSHRRASSSSSSSSSTRHTPLARSSSLTTPITTPRLVSSSPRSTPIPPSPSPSRSNSTYLYPPPSPILSSYSAVSSSPRKTTRSQATSSHVRSEGEKKELLRKLMPNVDALEQRFKMLGLGLG
ncbi:uncharacterized protein JCM6883_000453 [Sporobolomyces salmoneus]|uniref:uncharacterized protein n=1 Tax=Sporobolomyces salmoneus TaxID=183962 RepID=UPI00316DF185